MPLLLLLAMALSLSASAQSLNDKLIAEDPKQLVKDARAKGDIVRGAILFHQGNINCAKCHRSAAEQERIGPDLSRMEDRISDVSIVDSILQPSKDIKKGYETIAAETIDGRFVSGSVVSEDEDKIVIRDRDNIDHLITLLRSDLEGIRPGRKSTMPDNLANELKNRQQFLDLLKYVLDLRGRGPTSESLKASTKQRRELAPELQGLALMQKLNCVACHHTDAIPDVVSARRVPRLRWSAQWLNPNFIQRFIEDPHAVKRQSAMPKMFSEMEQPERKQAAAAITHFLMSNTESLFEHVQNDAKAIRRGFDLYHSVGCVACHSSRSSGSVEQNLEDSIPLGDVSRKYGLEGLLRFLEDPLAVRPSGHMPSLKLNYREAKDVASFLLQSNEPADSNWETNPELAMAGKSLFLQNCASCHDDFAPESLDLKQLPSLDQCSPEKGCLSGVAGSWPNFELTNKDRDSIRASLIRLPVTLSANQEIELSLKTFNCIACHDRDDLGGVTDGRNPHFQTTNLNLGDQGRIPPTLTGVGAKLKRKWMRDVLVNKRSIRPYMKTRMPQYGEQNVGHLIELFQANDKVAGVKFATFSDQKEMRKKGLELAGSKGLNCVACHTYKFKLSDTMPAVDLTEMSERLNKDWFYQYMLAPQKFSPNTVMPSFWPGGVAIRKDIPGQPADQIEALWQYLIDGRQAGTPRGVVRESLEIVVDSEAKMLRRKYPGIGKRGIGVGYPGGVNLAFDAEQMRLGMIWKGKFADPGGVWTGQGSGNVRPMGRIIEFPKGPELDSQTGPWVVDEGRPPKHQFKGYTLDSSQRPTFLYQFEDVQVQDFFTESTVSGSADKAIRRFITIMSAKAQDGLKFRVAVGSIKKAGQFFAIGKRLKIRIHSDQETQTTGSGENSVLSIPILLVPNEPEVISMEYVWE